MTRLIMMVALGAMLALAGTAGAKHKPKHDCTTNKAFVVKGVLTDSSTVTTTAVNDFDVTRANSHARKAGFGPDRPGADSANDPGSYELPAGKTVKLVDYEDGESPAAGDKVRVLGKIAFDSCTRDGDPRGYEGDPVIRKIQVIDSDDAS
jgi:hypothetical protein